jgi:hypothetical protein
MDIQALADQIVSQLESRQEDFMSCGGTSSGDEIAENETEIAVAFNTEGYTTVLTELLQAAFAKHSPTQDQAVELAAICFSKSLGLSDSEALELARESVKTE